MRRRRRPQTRGRGQRASVELVGNYEDDLELVGAQAILAQRLLGRGGGSRAAIMRAAMMGGRPSAPRTAGPYLAASTDRVRYLPLGAVALAAGPSVGTLTQGAQGAIQGERLILTTDAAAGEHTVTDVRVGYKPQMMGAAGVAAPIEAYAADATGSKMSFDPLKTGQDFSVALASTAVGATNASGLLIGTSAE